MHTDIQQIRNIYERTDLRVDPLDDAVHVKGVATLAPHYRAIVPRHFAIWAATIEWQPAEYETNEYIRKIQRNAC